jgi:hypothetical protein
MLRTMAETLGEVCSVTGRLRRRGLGFQTYRHVNVFFPATGRILFEQATYVPYIPDAVDSVVLASDDGWWCRPKHVEQFSDKINCITLHLVGYILEYLGNFIRYTFLSKRNYYAMSVPLLSPYGITTQCQFLCCHFTELRVINI